MSGSYSQHSLAATLMKEVEGECDSALAQLLAFWSLIPWRQHIVTVSALDTAEQGSQTVPVGMVTKGNSIGQVLVSLRCIDQAKN